MRIITVFTLLASGIILESGSLLPDLDGRVLRHFVLAVLYNLARTLGSRLLCYFPQTKKFGCETPTGLQVYFWHSLDARRNLYIKSSLKWPANQFDRRGHLSDSLLRSLLYECHESGDKSGHGKHMAAGRAASDDNVWLQFDPVDSKGDERSRPQRKKSILDSTVRFLPLFLVVYRLCTSSWSYYVCFAFLWCPFGQLPLDFSQFLPSS